MANITAKLPIAGRPRKARTRRANEFQPEVFLSLHHNADSRRDSSHNAVETYYRMTDAGPSLDGFYAPALVLGVTIGPGLLVAGLIVVIVGGIMYAVKHQ